MKSFTLFKILLWIILLGSVFQNIHAQENYLEAHIVTLEKDTVKGWVDYRNWERNPSKIFFKGNIEAEKIKYEPQDLLEFKVADEVYISAIVDTEVSPRQIGLLEKEKELQIKVDTVFLQTLIKGDKSLYYFSNNLYIKENDEFVLLLYKKYLKYVNGKKMITEYEAYKGQLKHYLRDCAALSDQINQIRYVNTSIQNLFYKYYDCSESSMEFDKVVEKSKLHVGLIAGVSTTSLIFKGVGHVALTNIDFPNSTNPTFGLYLNLKFPRDRGKWSLYNDLLIDFFDTKQQYRDFESEEVYTIVDSEFKHTYLKWQTMLRLRQLIGKFPIRWGIGGSVGVILSERNFERKEEKFYGTERESTGRALSEIRKYEQGVVFSVSTQYHRISIEARGEIGNGFSLYSGLKSSTRRGYLLLGYQLK